MGYRTLEEHEANAPASWQVVKVGERQWHLTNKAGETLDYFTRRCDAEAARESGFAFNLWHKHLRWMRGEPVAGWKPFAQCVEERERNDAWQANRSKEKAR